MAAVIRPYQTIGRALRVNFPELQIVGVPVRIDTGAKTSAIWASEIIEKDGTLSFKLFGPNSQFYTGEAISTNSYSQRKVASSFGTKQRRYIVRLLVVIEGRKIRASFTLADRSQQSYPILIGRNVLRGKFLVDVKLGGLLVSPRRTVASSRKPNATKQKGQSS